MLSFSTHSPWSNRWEGSAKASVDAGGCHSDRSQIAGERALANASGISFPFCLHTQEMFRVGHVTLRNPLRHRSAKVGLARKPGLWDDGAL